MTQVVSENPLTLESSIDLSRPDVKIFTCPDTNAGETEMTKYALERARTQLNFPNSGGPRDYYVSCCDSKRDLTRSAPRSKKRIEMNVMDPITGFLSPAGESLLRIQNRMPSFGKARIEPHCVIPQNFNSIRIESEAIDELKRTQENDPKIRLKWDSQKVIDNVLKSRLGGWTSMYDPRTLTRAENENSYRLKDIYPNMKFEFSSEEERDQMSKKYRYTTSTQEQVNWDSKLPKRMQAPITTYEGGKSDPLRKDQETEVSSETAKRLAGSDWDRNQYRNSYFTRQPVAFTAPTKRGQQIPGYSGYIDGIQKDDVIEKYTPLVVVRTKQPKETQCNYNANIVGYTGKYHFSKTTHVSHYDSLERPQTTTAAFQRPVQENYDQVRRVPSLSGDFARIYTKVPPKNPYDNVPRSTDTDVNNSIDFVKQPIVNAKNTNNPEFLVKNREAELKSILKKSEKPKN